LRVQLFVLTEFRKNSDQKIIWERLAFFQYAEITLSGFRNIGIAKEPMMDFGFQLVCHIEAIRLTVS
jgi:hypothetical protein